MDLVSPSVLDLQDGCLGGLISRTIPWTFLSHLTVWEITVSERKSAFFPPEAIVPFVMRRNLSSPCPLWVGLFWILVFTWAPDDIPSSLVPKQSLRGPLMFCCSYLQKNKGGEELNLARYWPVSITQPPSLPTIRCCRTRWKSVWVWLFSARRAVNGGAGGLRGGRWGEQLDGSQFIMSGGESTTDRFPLSPPLQHR